MEERIHKSVAVIGGGVAGMSAACALTEAGFRVHLIERRGYLGGRASSYLHPGVNEVIDNCQHALIGAYTNLMAFYRRVGVADKIHWTTAFTMIEPGGRRSVLGPSSLPAPLHGLPRLLRTHAFTASDKLSLARAFTAILLGHANDPYESLGNWLRRQRQSRGAMDRFWRLVIASALNAQLDEISMQYAAMVIRGLFMDSPEAGAFGMSAVPLSDLYSGVEPHIARHGGRLLLNTNVESASWQEETQQWELRTRDDLITTDSLVLALPFEATTKLIAQMPPAEGAQELLGQIERHTHWPICSVHLWFDREITDLDHAVLLDREIHWMYNKGRLQPWRKLKGSYLELVVSASRSFAALERKQAIDQAVAELAEFFPTVREARLEKAALVKEVRATFGVPPGIDSARPAAKDAPWPHCFLAGDWIATGWPSTMESAARSGHLAAEALCLAAGRPQIFLEPDLKPRGLMRLFS